ncbi:Uncharacterised protein [uncultured archaeon]|nr:Uncharacterised protein [uncultured archaeon]
MLFKHSLTNVSIMRKHICIDSDIAEELREFAKKKHGFVYGAVKAEAEIAINNHIRKGVENPNNLYFTGLKVIILFIYLYFRAQLF